MSTPSTPEMHWSRWGDPAQAGPLPDSAFALVDAFIAKAQKPELKTALQNDVRPHIVVHLAAAQELKARVGN